jgi:Methyltransferase domain
LSEPNLSSAAGHKSSFLVSLRDSLDKETFIKLSLGKSQGNEVARKLRISLVDIQATMHLRFLYQFSSRDITENHSLDRGCEKIAALIGESYLSANLFTTEADFSLLYNKRGQTALQRTKPTLQEKPPVDHNRKKNHVIEVGNDFLVHLEVTSSSGQLKPTMASKFKQINRFIEIIDELVRDSMLSDQTKFHVVDIGSGKGYLTFALYDFFSAKRHKEMSVIGIECRPELVTLCNQIAQRLSFDQLRFQAGQASQVDLGDVDIVIALHACDTATDDAIFRGVEAEASIILCAPCCQHELAPQLPKDHDSLNGIYRFGLLKQRQADLITDAARALLLEAVGYRVKVIEFISTEHTSKNLMIAAVKDPHVVRSAAKAQYHRLKTLVGFQQHELERLLRMRMLLSD